MQKTSVYLTEALKRRLAARAAATGLSEARLIRQGIEMITGDERPPPSSPAVAGRLVGVGVGPGSPDLITVRAITALRRADRVVAPCTSVDAPGRAEMIVRQAIPDLPVERVVFVMAPRQADREEALSQVSRTLVGHLDAGEEVAFVTLGDPNVYSTFSSVAASVQARRPPTVIESVPGVMAFQALAAAAGIPLTDERQSLLLLAANSEETDLDTALEDRTRAVVLYKGGRRLPAVADQLNRAGRLDRAVIGELLGFPGEQVVPVSQVGARPAAYLSTVIVPATDHTPTDRTS